ncbi:molybdenum cofactor biosynthesis protein C [Synechococcus sp. MEDNS5]|uniref:cyclic pyranopterin monophosphate synthase MoaC n=1 Tax=Synechococcus sp. MEDNS5 TaxID=1442554 RepID=UPI001646C82F|nr:cyclic pyranopterin monophosphate synthase MoaC [Synechococcus sp. MEDNS5]QNJ07439.1 molybdenum cofactor biosynthesis protein C [Synechococcus sp. MEDNS5]|tara:strand:- start:1093 stop:1569 length:477 start_codon:yes stop_codon:yes gene_type:complete
MSDRLTHLTSNGEVHMVDVGEKALTKRTATASGELLMKASTLDSVLDGSSPKGDVFAVARIAGIQGAKKTAELIPLCHPLPLSGLSVEIKPDQQLPGLRVQATCSTTGQTGVEMEAITAVSTALITLYDMLKSVDPGMSIRQIQLLEKDGGRHGHWRR